MCVVYETSQKFKFVYEGHHFLPGHRLCYRAPPEGAFAIHLYDDPQDPENRKQALCHRQWLAEALTAEELEAEFKELLRDPGQELVEPDAPLTREQYVKLVYLGDLEEAIKIRQEYDRQPANDSHRRSCDGFRRKSPNSPFQDAADYKRAPDPMRKR